MTKDDTSVLATEGLIDDPVNPYTGNPINSDAKNGPQTVFFTDCCLCNDNIGRNTFYPEHRAFQTKTRMTRKTGDMQASIEMAL